MDHVLWFFDMFWGLLCCLLHECSTGAWSKGTCKGKCQAKRPTKKSKLGPRQKNVIWCTQLHVHVRDEIIIDICYHKSLLLVNYFFMAQSWIEILRCVKCVAIWWRWISHLDLFINVGCTWSNNFYARGFDCNFCCG